jgi:hypothetical protein
VKPGVQPFEKEKVSTWRTAKKNFQKKQSLSQRARLWCQSHSAWKTCMLGSGRGGWKRAEQSVPRWPPTSHSKPFCAELEQERARLSMKLLTLPLQLLLPMMLLVGFATVAIHYLLLPNEWQLKAHQFRAQSFCGPLYYFEVHYRMPS